MAGGGYDSDRPVDLEGVRDMSREDDRYYERRIEDRRLEQQRQEQASAVKVCS
jgi:hypothetical protein